jgi:hypothetical protein
MRIDIADYLFWKAGLTYSISTRRVRARMCSPGFGAAIAQPANRGPWVSEDATVVIGDHRFATAKFEHPRGAIVATDRAAIERSLDRGLGKRFADSDGAGELGILAQPAIEGGEADREDAGEIRILGAEATEEVRLASEFGLVV